LAKETFKEIKFSSIKENALKLIGDDWMLLTAGNMSRYNMMTASWGALGVLWNRDVCICFIRPGRHTYTFVEKADHFTVCFFDEKFRDTLNFLGTKSGRDMDKMKDSGLTPAESGAGSVYFTQARLVLECRKLYFQDINPGQFLDPGIDKNYPARDYHRMYIGEITKCLIRK